MNSNAAGAYVPQRRCVGRSTNIRGVPYYVREWGSPEAPALVLLHGTRDSSATFQFVVDELRRDWRVISPDWRGHGHSGWTPGSYWLADFACDLALLLSELVPDGPVRIIGHSLGGNVAAMYAGLRPGGVERLVLLDALGNALDRSPVPMVATLQALLDAQQSSRAPRRYSSVAEMAERLMAANRRLDAPRANYLTDATARPLPGGGLTWAHDPTFRGALPTMHNTEEWGQCWQRISSPVLCLLSSDARPNAATAHSEHVREREAFFRDISVRRLSDTGHNMHHDAPAAIAEAIESFA